MLMQDAKPTQPAEDSSKKPDTKPAAQSKAVNAYLPLPGLKGESSDSDHKDWIESNFTK
jgi:hypothetical protein